MSIVKKWAGCVMSFIAGVLGLALSSCSGMKVVVKTPVGSETTVTKAFKVITDSDLLDQAKAAGLKSEFVMMKVFAIITLIVSVLLIVYSVVALLQNLNVIKSSHIAFDIAGWVLVGLFLVAIIGLVISSNDYGSEIASVTEKGLEATYAAMGQPINITVNAKLGAYQITMLVVSIVTAIVTGVFAFLKRKSA